jgi:LacI family transcriptional regulator
LQKRSKRQATLEDVARRVGVSAATVSRYVNDPSRVRKALRGHIQTAIDDLAYVPHAGARALVSSRSRMIGAVFPSLQTSLFGGVLNALQAEIAAAGYTVVVAASDYDPDREAEQIRTLLANGVDALMLVGADRDAEVHELIRRQGVPCVIIWVSASAAPFPCIGFDNSRAAADVANHLMDLGHRHFGVISGELAHNDRAAARLQGINAALAARGLGLPTGAAVQVDFGVSEGRHALRRLMDLAPRPTAVVCGSEPFAYGALFEAAEMGLGVPADVSIAGFDDMWLAAEITPALTTVRTPRAQMGTRAGRYLLSVLSGEEPPATGALPYELIVRRSTGPAPRR